MNKTTQTSRETSNAPNSNFNANIPQWSKTSSSEEEIIGIRKHGRKSNVGIKNEELKGSRGEAEEKCVSVSEKVTLIL